MNFGTIVEYNNSVEQLHGIYRLFKTVTGKVVVYKGLSSFNAVDKFSNGQDIDPHINRFNRPNVLRVFWYTPQKYWGAFAWDLPSLEDLIRFHDYVGSRGFYVENVCITDDNSSLLNDIKSLINGLKTSGLSNILFEAVNEPYVKEKLEPSVLRSTLDSTPYLYSSGINPQDFPDKYFGQYVTPHLPRDDEGVRKFKDLEEISSEYKIPSVSDEWAKPTDGNFSELDFYTHAAGSCLMGNGGTYHFESGKLITTPTDKEIRYGNAWFAGLNLYPSDACLGAYRHRQDLEEIVDGVPTAALRVFEKGSYAIIVRNKSVKIPSNWVPLDSYNVGFRIE